MENSLNIRAGTLLFYTALRSRFDPFLVSNENAQAAANTMLRIVVTLEQSITVESSTRDACLSASELWSLAAVLLRYLREVAPTTNVSFQSIDFVANFTQHVASVGGMQIAHDVDDAPSITNALENNFINVV